MDQKKSDSRRDFLKASGITAGAVISGIAMMPKAHAAGTDEIKIAVIGAGGRGSGAAADAINAGGNVKITAIADAFEDRAKSAAERLTKQFPDKVSLPPEKLFIGVDAYQKAIDSGVDMVIIAGPPGFRPQHYEAAIKAGKHVFMEKPVCVCPGGFRKVMEINKIAEEKNLKVGVGLQRHHQSGYLGNIDAIKEGKFGDISLLRVYWNGQDIWNRARKEGMNELQYQVHNWYHFEWLSGDNICEQHVHNIDIGNWVMSAALKKEGKDWAHPIEANGMGCSLTRGYNGKNIQGQIFDAHFVEFTYENGTRMLSQCRHQPGTWSSVSEWIHSSAFPKGTNASGQGPKLQHSNPYVQEHYDIQQAIKENKKYHEGWHGAVSCMTSVMGRMASYSGVIVKWDELVAKGYDTFPANMNSWDATPPVMPDANGFYPIPQPGKFKIYPKA